MAVYVDNMHEMSRGRFGLMKMSHMIADTDEELHAMADRIGVARRWHQYPGTFKSHYDIAKSKRALAVRFGAIEVDARVLVAMTKRKRAEGALGPAEDAMRWYLARLSSEIGVKF